MPITRIAVAALTLLSCSAVGAPADESRVQVTLSQSFDMAVPHAPKAFFIGRERRLSYELHLTNFMRDPLAIVSIEVIDGRNGRVLGLISGTSLESAFHQLGVAPDERRSLTVSSGRRGVVYIDLPLEAEAPASLSHRVSFRAPQTPDTGLRVVEGAGVAPITSDLPILGPPLRGGPWVAVYDPALERGHRRVHYAVAGGATLPGRHAIDWMRPSTTGGLPDALGSPSGAGAEVLAVADGVIVAARDDVAEVPSGTQRPAIDLGDATGNYIALQSADGSYAFYEHLAPGLSVGLGDRVRRGQVIARLGSTGQASRPHLHFHLADRNSPLGAEGLPYALSGWRALGSYPSIGAFDAGKPWLPAAAVFAAASMPSSMTVVAFDDG